MMKNVIVSWSSGKDSTLTLERLQEHSEYNVVGIYTTYVKDEVPLQATPIAVLDLQARLLDLPLIKIELPEVFPSNEVYQKSVVDGLKASTLSIDAVAFGDMFCNGIADYRRSYIEPAGWECTFPLMGESSHDLAKEIINRGIKTLVVTTDGHSLTSEYCGRWFDDEFLLSLPTQVDPCGEDGEFHTLVTQTSSFKGKLVLELIRVEMGERFSHQRYEAKALLNGE
ncbi:adenine nucleotide alpha hydrolase [Vibrio sinensis]|nr:adenine nucleotide alpha hydrolase [Vibrio sinensis]